MQPHKQKARLKSACGHKPMPKGYNIGLARCIPSQGTRVFINLRSQSKGSPLLVSVNSRSPKWACWWARKRSKRKRSARKRSAGTVDDQNCSKIARSKNAIFAPSKQTGGLKGTKKSLPLGETSSIFLLLA